MVLRISQKISDRSSGSFTNLLRRTDERKEDPRIIQGTFVGTPLYVSPEMLEFNLAGIFTDLWALGCIIYEMMIGKSPFFAKNSNEVFKKILERDIWFPSDFNKNAKDLIDKLLKVNPYERLGYNSYGDLKAHPFFEDIDFEKLESRELEVPDIDMFLMKCSEIEDVDPL